MNIMNNDRFPKNEYDELLEAVDGNLNDLIKDGEFVIHRGLYKTFVKFLEGMLVLSRELDGDFLKDYKKIENQNLFWKNIEKYVKKNNKSYEETYAIRNLTDDSYSSCIQDVFEKYIIYNDEAKKNKWLKEQDVAVTIKLIKFCVQVIIVKRLSLKRFKHFLEIMFGLENGKIEFLWNIIIENKNELQINYIISKLDELTSLVDDDD